MYIVVRACVRAVSVPMCTGCTEPIFDRFILKVQDRSWHSRCLKCSDCHAHLSDKCFSKGDDVYCKDDFFRYGSRDSLATGNLYKLEFHGTSFPCSILKSGVSARMSRECYEETAVVEFWL